MTQEIKIKELSETEELSNNYSITIPERFLYELDWSDEYCTKLTLDKVHNQIIISQSDIKVKNNLKPLVSKEQFFIIEQVEKGKSYKEIAKELNFSANIVKLRYEIAYEVLKDYLNKKYNKTQVGIPKNFIIPKYIIEQVEKEKKENLIAEKMKAIRKFENLSQKQFAEKMNITPSTYSYLECGNFPFDLDTIKLIANLFHVDFFSIVDSDIDLITFSKKLKDNCNV